MLTYKKVLGEVNPSPSVPSLYQSLRELLMNEVCEDIVTASPLVEKLTLRIREQVPIYEMKKQDSFTHVSGVDAGSQILSLASRRYAVLSALVYSLPSGRTFFEAPETLSFPFTSNGANYIGVVNIKRETKLYETALSFIEADKGVELLLLDGPLAFSNWWSMSGSKEDRRRLIESINKVVERCQDENIVLAGIVKRPSARYLMYILDLQRETDLPDSYLLHHTLMPGERTEIFSPRAAVRKTVRDAPFMDGINCPIYSIANFPFLDEDCHL